MNDENSDHLEQKCALSSCPTKAGDIDDCLYPSSEGWVCGPCLYEINEFEREE